ncbi:MAG TPA: hypothetical protein VMH27_08380 [Puia sp.]|nr:hypothetical protein [Puia sp.]
MRFVWTILAVSGLFVIAIGLHIYVVTRPRADGHSRGMARIDLHQTIGRDDAQRISGWLSRQKGVDHVMVNPGAAIAVFTYRPAAANPGLIVRAFRDSLRYDRAVRYMPSVEEVRKGCPMTTSPVTNKIYVFLKGLF